MRRRMAVALAVIVLVALAVASQIALPRIAADRIAGRLTANGGTASVSVSAWPAVRLLFGDGGRLSVDGSGLDLEPNLAGGPVFGKLDGFDRVSIHLASFRAGPFRVGEFTLTRDGSGAPYALDARARTSGAALGAFAAAQLGLPGWAPIGAITGLVPATRAPIPIALDMQLASEDGAVRVISGSGTVAGIPAGPLAELITSAVAIRL